MKQALRKLTPRPLLLLYNRLISRAKISRRYGPAFDLEWKQKAGKVGVGVWRETYDRSWQEFAQQDLSSQDFDKIEELVPEGASVLDAGCGDGALLGALAGKNRRLFGIDLSPVGLKLARRRLGSRAIFTNGLLENLPFPDRTFDVVVTAHTLEHVQNLGKAVSELRRVCRERLIILVPAQEYLPYTEDYHVSFFPTESELLRQIPIEGASVERYTGIRGDVWLLWKDLTA